MREMTDHQRNVQKALEGNERVWFHPFEDQLAIWHGGPQVLIVSSRTFEEMDVMNVRTWDRDLSQIEKAVEVKLATRGFARRGRSTKRSQVVEA